MQRIVDHVLMIHHRIHMDHPLNAAVGGGIAVAVAVAVAVVVDVVLVVNFHLNQTVDGNI